MNWFHTMSILLAALIGVFLEAAVTFPRDLLGAQINPLPALVVYAALHSNLATLTLVVICGSLWQSALSADPLGIALLPLFLVGTFIEFNRKQFARRERFVRFTLGTAASASVLHGPSTRGTLASTTKRTTFARRATASPLHRAPQRVQP